MGYTTANIGQWLVEIQLNILCEKKKQWNMKEKLH